jgi:peptidoglycan/LPS O-acetylase OafA/YrhL
MAMTKSQMKSMPTGKYELIQVLRFIAALGVVICHSAFYSKERLDPDTFSYNLGANGVPLFFVISGFVMMVAAQKLQGVEGAWKLFSIRRIVRIAPLYWFATTVKLVTLIGAAGLVLHAQVDWAYIVKSYFFVPAVNIDGEIRPLLAVGWTLLFEMFFYAIFTLSLLFRIDAIRFSAPLLVGLAIASFFKTDAWNAAIAFYADPIVLNFLWGMVTARLLQGDMLMGRNGALTVVVISLCYLFFPRFPEYGNSISYGIASFFAVFGCACLEKTLRFSVSRWLVFLGTASYSIYLFHPLIAPVAPVLFRRFGLMYPLLSVLGSIAIAIGVGAVMYRFLESPLTERLNRYVKKYFNGSVGVKKQLKGLNE